MDLDGFGDEFRDGGAPAPQLVIVVLGGRAGVGAEHAGIRAVAGVLRLGARHAEEAGESLIDLGKLLRVGILALVPEEISRREAAPVRPIHRVSVAVAALVRIEEPPPTKLVFKPLDVTPLDDQLAIEAVLTGWCSDVVRSAGWALTANAQ